MTSWLSARLAARVSFRPGVALPVRRRGFTLAEILIGVLILGIGLLGIAAIFPMVVTQQRRAADVVFGATAARTVESAFRSGGAWAELLVEQDGIDTDGSGGYDDEVYFGGDGGESDNGQLTSRFLWETDWAWSGPDESFEAGGAYVSDGLIEFGPAGFAEIPVAARLFPAPSGGLRPEFVWDFVPRRVPGGSIQVAIFVRRIDPGIRVPADGLVDALIDPDDSIYPVGFENGSPTRDGTGQYSVPLSLTAVAVNNFANGGEDAGRIIELSAGTFAEVTQALQGVSTVEDAVGFLVLSEQQIVDNLGVVRRVVGPVDGESNRIRVEPAYSEIQLPGNGFGSLRQIVFTPQVPAYVSVITVSQ